MDDHAKEDESNEFMIIEYHQNDNIKHNALSVNNKSHCILKI